MNALNAEQSIATRKILQSLEFLRTLDQDMPIGAAVAFLLVAQGETKDSGISVTDIAKLGEFALSTASRYMNYLNLKDRRGNAGLELIDDPRDPEDDRRKVLKLTAQGRRVVSQLTNIIVGG